MNQQEFKLKIKQTQSTLGITPQNFRRKFIFQQQESLDSFYLQRFTPTPSQILHNLPENQQNRIRALACQMITEAGMLLRLPITTVISAQTIFHFFYQRVSFLQYDYRQIIMGCLFLAGKSQQTLRRSAHVALVFDTVFKIHQKERRPVRVLDVNNNQYTYIKGKVLETQRIILIQLGFQVYRLLETPHRYMNTILTLFSRHKRLKDIAKLTWAYLNDSYRTKVCLYYPSQMIASACIYLSIKKLDLNMPSVAWWCLLETSFEAIEQICVEILNLYELNIQYNSIHDILTKIGNNNNIQHVFAVPYYRKITIQNRKKEKLLFEMERAASNIIERQSLNVQKQEGIVKQIVKGEANQRKKRQKSESIQSRSNDKKKKKQKQKKKKKNKSRSRSDSRRKQKRKNKKQKKHKKNYRKDESSGESQSQNQSQEQKIKKNQQSLLPIKNKNQLIMQQNNEQIHKDTTTKKDNLLNKVAEHLKAHKQKKIQQKVPSLQQKPAIQIIQINAPLQKKQQKQEDSQMEDQQQRYMKQLKQKIRKKREGQLLGNNNIK